MSPIGRMCFVPQAAALLLSISPAFGANAVVGSGAPGSCTEAALDAAIATANSGGGTVTFSCGADPVVLVATGAKAITDNVVIDADGLVTLSGGETTRLFEISGGADVTLRDLAIVDGVGTTGGAIEVNGASLRLDHVTIERCSASADGGALHVVNSVVILRYSRLAGNEAGGSGGAIHQTGGSLDIAASILHGNEAAQDGGAVAAVTLPQQLKVYQSSIDGNLAGRHGGAIDVAGTGGFVDQSQIVWNEAGENGGAIRLSGTSAISFSHDTLARNVAGRGGALHLSAGSSSVQDRITYSHNEASAVGAQGGAIANLGTLLLENSTFSANFSDDEAGAIHNEGSTTLRFVTLAFNQAATGGAISSSGPTLQLRNVVLAQDTATDGSNECAITGGSDITASLWEGVTCGVATTGGNLPNTDPLLRPLAFSCPASTTELTRTHDLDPSSPARDSGIAIGGNTTFMDQRMVLRPQGVANDRGAVEYSPSSCAHLFRDNFEFGNTFAWTAEY